MIRRPPRSTRTDTRFPYTTRFRSENGGLPRLPGQVQDCPTRGCGYAPRECCGSSRGRSEATRACRRHRRSEEHTSELQSLMRISYAVFCLKKKNQLQTTHMQTNGKRAKDTHYPI